MRHSHIKEFLNRPQMICAPCRHRRSYSVTSMNPHEIIMGKIQLQVRD